GIDVGLALDVDATGAAWVGGYSTLTVGRDAWIGKYSASGEQLWASTFDFSPGRDDLSQAIASDPSGGIYAGGYETDSSELPHAWVRRYDSSGNVLWTKSSVLPGEVRSLAV